MKIEKGTHVINRNNITSITQFITSNKYDIEFDDTIGYVLDYEDYHYFVKYGDKYVWESYRDLIPVLREQSE